MSAKYRRYLLEFGGITAVVLLVVKWGQSSNRKSKREIRGILRVQQSKFGKENKNADIPQSLVVFATRTKEDYTKKNKASIE